MKTQKIEAQLLSCKAKPYNFEGKSGISYRSTFLVGDQLLSVKTTEQQYEEMKDLKNQDGELTLALSIYDGKLLSKLESFDWK